MKALDAYKGLLKELDKHESPTFTIGDFNYFFNKTVQDYITENYKDLDPVQKDIDDIRSVLKFGESLNLVTNGDRFDLPEKYQHILYLEFTCTFLEDDGRFKKGDKFTFTEVRREKSSQRGTRNAYRRKSVLRPYYRMDKLYIYPILDEVVEIESAKIDFIMIPSTVYLNPDKSSDYNSDANNTTLEFPDYVVKEMIDMCKLMFLENTENPRFQSAIIENQVQTE